MRAHLSLALTLFAALGAVATGTGSRLFLVLTLLIALVIVFCFFSVLWAASTLSVSVTFPAKTVSRGDELRLTLAVRHQGLLPIAPVLLDLSLPFAALTREVRLRDMPGRRQVLTIPVRAAHVGCFPLGVRSCTVEDLFGLFQKKVVPAESLFELLVLPQTFDTEPLTLSPGDPGSDMIARATEDLNAPSDIRSYQPGDAMKKIHWKLSLRKGELIVRKFDEPILQEVLILLDCSRPPSWDHPMAEADMRDALIETAASVFLSQLRTDHLVHLPLQGSHPMDIEKSMDESLALENLARVDFSATERFERVLALESRRLRKVGCLVVISGRLTASMVDIMSRMRRIGPALRFYLITFAPDDPSLLPLISRLRQAEIQVSYVTPAAE